MLIERSGVSLILSGWLLQLVNITRITVSRKADFFIVKEILVSGSLSFDF
jgi:hypothetical protein